MTSSPKILAGPVKRDQHILRAISIDGKVQVEQWDEDESQWKRSPYMLSDVHKGRMLTPEERAQYGIDARPAPGQSEAERNEAARALAKQRADHLATAMTRHLHYQTLIAAAAGERDPERRRQYEEEAERLRTQLAAGERNEPD